MAMAMREAAGKLIASWRRRGRLLGFAERSGYTAIGTVCNLAARLCAEAFFFQAEDGIRVGTVTGVQTCALPIFRRAGLDLGVRLVELLVDRLLEVVEGLGAVDEDAVDEERRRPLNASALAVVEVLLDLVGPLVAVEPRLETGG